MVLPAVKLDSLDGFTIFVMIVMVLTCVSYGIVISTIIGIPTAIIVIAPIMSAVSILFLLICIPRFIAISKRGSKFYPIDVAAVIFFIGAICLIFWTAPQLAAGNALTLQPNPIN